MYEQQTSFLIHYEFDGKPNQLKILDTVNDDFLFSEEQVKKFYPFEIEDMDLEDPNIWEMQCIKKMWTELKKKHPISNFHPSSSPFSESEWEIYRKIALLFNQIEAQWSWEQGGNEYEKIQQDRIWKSKIKINKIQFLEEFVCCWKIEK